MFVDVVQLEPLSKIESYSQYYLSSIANGTKTE